MLRATRFCVVQLLTPPREKLRLGQEQLQRCQSGLEGSPNKPAGYEVHHGPTGHPDRGSKKEKNLVVLERSRG